MPPLGATDQQIDLDGNPINGAESRVETRVLATYPVRVENVVFNNAGGKSFTFDWAGAGPGGFGSVLAPGPDVGTKWEWTTLSQVYSILSPAVFKSEQRGVPLVGAGSSGIQGSGGTGEYLLPGKSIYPTAVTVSSASLTSSLITFFSPEREIASCGGSFTAGRYEQTITNDSGGTINFQVEQQDCCPEPQMTICQDGCKSYLTDPDNCGGCGIQCGDGEVCSDGVCDLVCTDGLTECGNTCVDLASDPNNCGACGNVCAADEFCGDGVCERFCPIGETLCGDTCVDLTSDPANCGECGNACGSNDICDLSVCVTCRPPRGTACDNECTNINTDPFNCGGCGNVCDFTDCPSTGQGTCSQGQSCICVDDGALTALSFSPIPIPRASRDLRGRGRGASSRGPRRGDGTLQATTGRALRVIEAPVCDIEPLDMMIEDGAEFTQCLSGGVVGKEIFTTARVQVDGRTFGEGPCALIVPDPQATVPAFLPSTVMVTLEDESSDGLFQPGETGTLWVTVANLGSEPLQNPVATLSSPPDALNPLPLAVITEVSQYDDFPAFEPSGDCDVEPQLESRTNLLGYTVTIPPDHESDVGRPFYLGFEQEGGSGPMYQMPFVIGIGRTCDPTIPSDGETFDGLAGFLEPVDAQLVPSGNPLNVANGDFNQGKTIPLKFRLLCGGAVLDGGRIDPKPEIVGIVGEVQGSVPLTAINAANGANPDDPFFVCGSNRCEYQLRTVELIPDTYTIRLKMPDSRVFEAALVLRP